MSASEQAHADTGGKAMKQAPSVCGFREADACNSPCIGCKVGNQVCVLSNVGVHTARPLRMKLPALGKSQW